MTAGYVSELHPLLLLALLGLLMLVGGYSTLLRRFRPLPETDHNTDERQVQQHAAAYRTGFLINWGLGIVLLLTGWVASLRGVPVLPAHPLAFYLPLTLLLFSALTPTLVLAWQEPDDLD